MSNNSVWGCTIISWVLAGVIGVLLAALLWFLGDWRPVQAIALGLLAFALGGIFITQVMCGESAYGAVSAPAEDAEEEAKTEAAPARAKKPATKKKPAAPKPPVLFESRPDQVDDLKLISGVGPKLEQKLHETGVYQFAQVANWKKADVAMVDDKLSFKGRIDRDEWIKQAKVLAKGGDTEFSAKKRK
ncbi:MAG: hypothetical protein AAGA63_11350 [Pseudomonadota bacterium]